MSTADPRYPVGTFQFGLPVSAQERPVYLTQVEEAPEKLRAAVANLSDAATTSFLIDAQGCEPAARSYRMARVARAGGLFDQNRWKAKLPSRP